MNQDLLLDENLSNEEKLSRLYLLVEGNLRVRHFYDPDSNKNIDLKLKVLNKIYNHEDLTDEEMLDKRVWEKMPDDVTLETILD